MPSITRNEGNLAEQLFAFIAAIIGKSPDKSCFASLSFLAKSLHRRKSEVHAAKLKLIAAGRLNLSLRPNGKRKNPKHRLTLPQQPPARGYYAMYRVPDRVLDCGSCGARPLVGFNLWHELPRLDLVDCYLKSGWNVCPLKPLTKFPVHSRRYWSRLSRDRKLDVFYHRKDYGVGLWLEADKTVFDFDSARPVLYDTLTSRRGNHHHLLFQGHEEIFNTSKQVAHDIDTRACGGLLVLPPTVHESGDLYTWETLRAPIPVPPDLLELWHNRKARKGGIVFRLGDLPEVIPHGERDNTIWSYGRRLKASGVIYDELEMRLRMINLERCRPPLGERQMAAKIRHIWTHRNDPNWNGAGRNY